jgi:hypothetical protein
MINETKISITYEGDGVTTSFPFPYPYRDAGDIIGYLVDEFESEKKIETNYTYNKEENKYIYPVAGEPIKKPNKIKLIRSTPMQQNVDLPNKMPYISIEKELDWMIMILQEMGYDVEIAKETANAVEAGKEAQIEILAKTNEIKNAVEKLKEKTEETKNETVGLKENVESLKKDTEIIKNAAEQYKKDAKASADKAAALAGTFEDFTGATATKDGTGGKVPKPLKGEQDKYLKGSGEWGVIPELSLGSVHIIQQLALTKMITVISSLQENSWFGQLLKWVLTASGVRYNLAGNGYICLGSFFGGLIIQWGSTVLTVDGNKHSIQLPIPINYAIAAQVTVRSLDFNGFVVCPYWSECTKTTINITTDYEIGQGYGGNGQTVFCWLLIAI